MIRLYGTDISSPVLKVRFTLHLADVEYEYVPLNLAKGEHKTPEFQKLNPVGKVPVLTDGDFSLFESVAIMRYVARLNKSSLYPNNIRAQAVIDQWQAFVELQIGVAMNRVVFNRLMAPVIGVEVDEKSLQTGLDFLDKFLPIIEAELEKRPYLAGETISLADISLLGTLEPASLASVDLERFPKLSQYLKSLRSQEFYTRVHDSYESSVRKIFPAS